jgi:hypothetical protein
LALFKIGVLPQEYQRDPRRADQGSRYATRVLAGVDFGARRQQRARRKHLAIGYGGVQRARHHHVIIGVGDDALGTIHAVDMQALKAYNIKKTGLPCPYLIG